MTAFLSALGFLTVVPVPVKAASNQQLSQSRAFFPLVGLLLGLALAGLDWALRQALPVGVTSALLVAVMVAATRALHLDGLMDTCDGVFGGHTRERRLEIMKDSHVGAFAVAGAICVLLVQWAALAALPTSVRFWPILLFPMLSRWGMAFALSLYPYAREQGLGTPFQGPRAAVSLGFAALTALVASFLFGTWGGLLLFGVAMASGQLLGRWLSRMLGGLTGDTYGAINEVTSALVLVLAVGMTQYAWLLPVFAP